MSDTEDGEVAVHHVWDPVLGVSRPLAEDEWELESHWAGLLEVHGEKMPGHDWMFVVPKYKLEAAEARVTELLAERGDLRKLVRDLRDALESAPIEAQDPIQDAADDALIAEADAALSGEPES